MSSVVCSAQPQHARAEGNLGVATERTLPCPYRPRQHLDHAHITLELRHRRIVHAAHAHFGHEPGHRRKADPGLAERREHLLDVAEEQRVRPDDEDTLALEREPVRVEQVGGSVQRDRGLAGSRPALDDQHASERGADDLVLLALDGRDDVTHVPGAGLAQGREQRAGPTQHHPVREQALAVAGTLARPTLRACASASLSGFASSCLSACADCRRGATRVRCETASLGVDEVLVLEAEHRTPAHRQVAAARQALGIESRGPVERLGDRGTPVHDQRLVVRTRHGQPADVERLAERWSTVLPVAVAWLGQPIDAPEVERLVPDVELFEAGEAGSHNDVALGARLERASSPEVEYTLEHVAGLAPHELQPVVGTVEVLLLIL